MRYARQTVLPELGEEGQNAFARAKVLIVGVGGLGSPLALYLAAAGIGELGLVDADKVGLSNLQRQILFATPDLGQPKVDIAQERLKALNPEVLTTLYPYFLDSGNALDTASHYDIIVDASDNFETKYLLNDLCVKLSKPLVSGSILKFQGQAAIFWADHGPCYRCLFPEPPTHAVPNCAEAGVLGALAGVIGSIQALEVMKLILLQNKLLGDHQSTLIGRFLSFDAGTMQQSILKVRKDPACGVCSLRPETIALPTLDLSCALPSAVDFEEQWQTYKFIDVRSDEEWVRGHIPTAVHWPLAKIRAGEYPEIHPGATVIYCQSGVRSREALNLLKAAGFAEVLHLPEGFGNWGGAVAQGR